MNAILALDAGTTNVKAILVDREANILARSSVPLATQFPKSGWVEQSARDIWDAARKAVTGSGLSWALALTGFKDLESAAKLATGLEDNGNVYFVPALAGLGAPHWDEKARGSIVGLSFGTKKENVVRAALEAIAFQVKDVFDAMQEAAGVKLEILLTDGGASKNDWLMQFQADLLDRQVMRSQTAELSGLGAAFAAGLGCGFWPSSDEVAKVVAPHDAFHPGLEESERDRLVRRWHGAVASVKAYGQAQ